MANAAVIVGIDEYDEFARLSGCVNDAEAMQQILCTDCRDQDHYGYVPRMLLSSEARVEVDCLRQNIDELFKNDLDVALFYFAGHGALTSSGSFLVTQEGRPFALGLPMAELIARANASPAREKVIILDCCHSGAVDQLFGAAANLAALGRGVSILAACRDSGTAAEVGGNGVFTSAICHALAGGAADVRGVVTVAGVYAYLDQVLSVWDQRPVFKANVEKLVALRHAEPAVPDEKLRLLPEYFPDPEQVFPLDSSYEPTAEPRHPEHEAAFSDLQRFRGARLVKPDGTEHMYYAAICNKSCSLTPLGKFYWRWARRGGR